MSKTISDALLSRVLNILADVAPVNAGPSASEIEDVRNRIRGLYEGTRPDITEIPPPPTATETQEALAAGISSLDPQGGSVLADFCLRVIQVAKEFDDVRGLGQFLTSVFLEFDDATFRSKITIKYKNCEIDAETLEALRRAEELADRTNSRRNPRHIDVRGSARRAE